MTLTCSSIVEVAFVLISPPIVDVRAFGSVAIPLLFTIV